MKSQEITVIYGHILKGTSPVVGDRSWRNPKKMYQDINAVAAVCAIVEGNARLVDEQTIAEFAGRERA
jgi:hypothetical protein